MHKARNDRAFSCTPPRGRSVPLTEIPVEDPTNTATTGDVLGNFFDRIGCAIRRRIAKRLRRLQPTVVGGTRSGHRSAIVLVVTIGPRR